MIQSLTENAQHGGCTFDRWSAINSGIVQNVVLFSVYTTRVIQLGYTCAEHVPRLRGSH